MDCSSREMSGLVVTTVGSRPTFLPRQDRQLGQQAQGGAVDAFGFGQVDDDRREVQRSENLLDRRIQRRTQGQAHFTDEFQDEGAALLGELDSTGTH
jgi:hypothetical protein